MAKEILRLEDYQSIQILGLEPKDRQPHDYLRMIAKIFNSFKNIDPEVTLSTYLSGFVSTIVDLGDTYRFNIEKGTGFVDDQFIGFTDGVILDKPKAHFVNGLDYFLVLKYQYTNQFPGNVPQFDFSTENGFDPAHMLKILKFKIDGTGNLAKAIAYPQNLDKQYMDNFGKLFELLESKVVQSMDIMKYQFYKVQLEELYVDTVNNNRSTRSGDIVYLDTVDKLYKPARACNKRLDKAIGVYLYNPINDDHIIATAGIIDFDKDFNIDDSNNILLNLEAGRSYYLLDGCTETNYPYETAEAKKVAGKMSSRFFPGTVRAGFAIDNTTFMLDFDYSADMNIKNILEIIGLPEEFHDRYQIFYNYYLSLESRDRLQELSDTLNIAKNDLIEELDTKITDISVQEGKTTVKENVYLSDTLVTTVTDNDLLEAFNEFFNSQVTSQSEAALSDAIIFKSQEFIPMYENLIDVVVVNLTAIKTIVDGIQNITVPSNYYFQNSNDLINIISGIPNARDNNGNLNEYAFETIEDWAIPNLNALDRIATLTHSVAERPKFYAADVDTTITATNIAHSVQPTYNTKSARAAKSGHASLATVNIIRNQVDYNQTDTKIWGVNVVETLKTNGSILSSSLDTIIGTFNNVKDNMSGVLTNINNKDIDELKINVDSSNSLSFIDKLEGLNTYLFDKSFNNNNIIDQIGKVISQSELLTRADIYNNATKNALVSALFKIADNVYSIDFSGKQLRNIILGNVIPYLENLDDTTFSTNIDIATTKMNQYITDRNNYETSKFQKFQDYSTELSLEDKMNLERIELQRILDDLINTLNIMDTITIPELNNEVTSLDDTLLARINEERSIHSIFYLSDHERTIYNYTYITLRLRLKYKNKVVIENNVSIISDKLFLLKNEPIPDYELITRLESTQLSYQSILNVLNEEVEAMVVEYNMIRTKSFGIEPIVVGDTEFDDGGYANTDLDGFASIQ